MLHRLESFALVAVSIAAIGCGHNVHPRSYDPPGEQLILHDEIIKSGAVDAWEAVRRLSHMTTSTTASGEPSRMYRRGHGSIVIRETPMVVVDGIQATDLQILTQVRPTRSPGSASSPAPRARRATVPAVVLAR